MQRKCYYINCYLYYISIHVIFVMSDLFSMSSNCQPQFSLFGHYFIQVNQYIVSPLPSPADRWKPACQALQRSRYANCRSSNPFLFTHKHKHTHKHTQACTAKQSSQTKNTQGVYLSHTRLRNLTKP